MTKPCDHKYLVYREYTDPDQVICEALRIFKYNEPYAAFAL